MTTSVLEKIGGLLNQAAGTKNEQEQNTYFKKAQLLARKYEIDLELARQTVTNKQKRQTPIHKTINIGQPGKPLNAVFCQLFMDIGEPQGLKFNIAHNSTYVVAFGMPSDIEMAEGMYAIIVPQMVKMADTFIKDGSWRGEETLDTRTWRMKPVTARVARRCFYEAFSSRIQQRFREANREAEAQEAEHFHNVTAGIEDTQTGEAPVWETKSTALVLQEKALEVSDFYKRTSTARGSWKGNRGNTANSTAGRRGGREAGDRAQLHGRRAIG